MRCRYSEQGPFPAGAEVHVSIIRCEVVRRMKKVLLFAAVAVALTSGVVLRAAELTRPKAGKVEIFPLKDIKPGMHATAWTVFSGTEPESVPIEIIGVWKNQIGPHQD